MNDDEVYERDWNVLYIKIKTTLNLFGRENSLDSKGDFWIIDEPYGFEQHNVYIHNFALLKSNVVSALQRILPEFPGWEIFLTLYIRAPEARSWPNMGLIIREHEIIDGLQRQYFPLEYQSIQYEGSRVGTD